MPKPWLRWRTSLSVSTKVPGSSSLSMRSRAVSLPRSCCLATAASSPACSASASLSSSSWSRCSSGWIASPGMPSCVAIARSLKAGGLDPPGPKGHKRGGKRCFRAGEGVHGVESAGYEPENLSGGLPRSPPFRSGPQGGPDGGGGGGQQHHRHLRQPLLSALEAGCRRQAQLLGDPHA